MTQQANQSPTEDCCKCLPYRDGVLISAQGLSIVGVCLLWFCLWAIPFGLVAFIMLQVVWCCKMNKCGLITAGVFAALAAALMIIKGILVAVSGVTLVCSSSYNDDYYYYSDYDDDACNAAVIIASSLAISGGVFWIATAVCTFVFACGPRYMKLHDIYDDGDNTATATPVGTVVGADTNTFKPDDVEQAR
mmetsp:Transcript_15558/g.25215  ORF Transcript_15558/g.25215 Transcript_15558/m.25215 type:complete len:191 (+) Transcript_15558:68-640(+)